MDQMKRRAFVGQVAGIAGMVGLGSAMALSPKTASAAPAATTGITIPFKQNGVTGTLNITQFIAQEGQILATGVATVTTAANTIGITNFTAPVTITNSTCEILSLHIGAIHLTLLGLNVDLAAIDLNITANPAGGLLGQLLCSIANLLSGGLQNVLNQVANVLNQLLGAL